jgi:hypothetical protein
MYTHGDLITMESRLKAYQFLHIHNHRLHIRHCTDTDTVLSVGWTRTVRADGMCLQCCMTLEHNHKSTISVWPLKLCRVKQRMTLPTYCKSIFLPVCVVYNIFHTWDFPLHVTSDTFWEGLPRYLSYVIHLPYSSSLSSCERCKMARGGIFTALDWWCYNT